METKTETRDKQHPSVAVVILNWNGRYFLEKFLPSVYNSTYPNIRFVVGDNASTDDSVDFVRAQYPQVELIINDKNYGFAGGYNRVLEHVDADYYVLLNSDVEVSPNWIEPIIAYLEAHTDVAVVQPKLRAYHDRDRFEYAGAAGGFIDRFGFPFCRGRIFQEAEVDHGQYNDPQEIFWASGAAFFIRKQCWEEAGGFDEDFFAHMEEIDLCWRLKRLGYKIAYCPDAIVYHVGGGTLASSNPFKTKLNFRNNLWMLQKNLPFWTACWVIFIRLWFDFFALLMFLFTGRSKDALAVHQSHKAFFGSFFKTAKKRKVYPHKANTSGLYKGSIVFDYYVRGYRKFTDIPWLKVKK